VSVIDKIIDKIDISPIVEKYKGGGTSSYHPLILLKVFILCLHTGHMLFMKDSKSTSRKYNLYVGFKTSDLSFLKLSIDSEKR